MIQRRLFGLFSLVSFLIVSGLSAAAAGFPPQFLNASPTYESIFDANANMTFSSCWNGPVVSAELWVNESGSLKKNSFAKLDGTCLEAPIAAVLGSSQNACCATVTYKTPKKLTAILWYMNATNSSGSNQTDERFILVKDLSAPQYSAVSQNATIAKAGDVVLFAARWRDKINLSTAMLFINDTGAIRNFSKILNGTEDVSSFEIRLFENLSESAAVEWKISVNDSFGNKNTTELQVFFSSRCPQVCEAGFAPGTCTKWSECSSGLQSRFCFSCGKETSFSCLKKSENKTCETLITISSERTQASEEISRAQDEIDSAKNSPLLRNTTEAEKLLSDARKSFDVGDFIRAKELAVSARDMAISAPIITRKEEKPFDYTLIIFGMVFVLLLAGGYFFQEKIISLLQKKSLIGRTEDKAKAHENICEICGRTFEKLYSCGDCGKKICFDDARTYQEKTYCLDCLRKRGLI